MNFFGIIAPRGGSWMVRAYPGWGFWFLAPFILWVAKGLTMTKTWAHYFSWRWVVSKKTKRLWCLRKNPERVGVLEHDEKNEFFIFFFWARGQCWNVTPGASICCLVPFNFFVPPIEFHHFFGGRVYHIWDRLNRDVFFVITIITTMFFVWFICVL